MGICDSQDKNLKMGICDSQDKNLKMGNTNSNSHEVPNYINENKIQEHGNPTTLTKIPPNMFDKRGNKEPNNYTIQGLRGGRIYKGPIGWTGFGFSVLNKYDNGDNTWLGMTGNTPGEWCVAYHTIHIEYVKSIIFNGFKEGINQTYANNDDINHPGQKVGRGVYVTPDIKIAEVFTRSNGIKCVLMCRVNPLNLRIPKSNVDFWVVSGNSSDIRPYRLLIKYE
jgi:hypothetical protein